MQNEFKTVENGGVASAAGFVAGGTFAGIKRPGRDKRDLGLLFSEMPCAVAGAFSQNSIVSPSVTLSRDITRQGHAVRGAVVESGSANCAVGEQGLIDARDAVALAAKRLNVEPQEILIGTTGLIGVELPMKLIAEHIPNIELSRDGGTDFARAMMTTDTCVKQCAVQFETSSGGLITIGGAAKGSGMINPNMATMLAFATTDAAVERAFLQAELSEIVNLTFNQIDVDGDLSPNDTTLVFANGAAKNAELNAQNAQTEDARRFRQGLFQVCKNLAMAIARDAEGGKNRLIEVHIIGAKSDLEARQAARSVASSLLVKTAVYGHDPNWGRIMMAVGKAQVGLDESKLSIFINGIKIVEDGRSLPFNVQSVVGSLAEATVSLKIDLAVGAGEGFAWGGELTEEYIIFNSAYTT